MSSLQFSFNVSAAESFLNDVSRETGSYYMMISKPQPWDDDNIPDFSTDNTKNQVSVWKNSIAAKRIRSKDIRLVINRNQWTSGTVYSEFSDSDSLFRSQTYTTNPFYVTTSDYRVYKCIKNGGGNSSTVEPTHVHSEIQTADTDGYVWKFMYQISEDDFDFITEDYVPVSLAGSTTKIGTIEYLQREVQENAGGGSVYNIRVNQSGNYWADAHILKGIPGEISTDFNNTHTITGIDNNAEYFYDGVTYDVAKFTVIASSLNSDKDFYRNWALTDLDMGTTTHVSGDNDFDMTLISFYKRIIGNDGNYIYTERLDEGTQIPTDTPPGSIGSAIAFYNIVPYFYISSGTGSTQESNVVIYPTFNDLIQNLSIDERGPGYDREGILQESKTVSEILVLNSGSDVYEPYVNLRTPTNDTNGTGFQAEVYSSPLGGHGSNAVYELGANKIMIRTLLSGSESGAFDVQNDYRQFSIIKDPQYSGWTSGYTAGYIAGRDNLDYTTLEIKNPLNTALIKFRSEGGGSPHESDAFTVGQKVYQGEYNQFQARGTVLSWNGGADGSLVVSVDNGSFRSSTNSEIPTSNTGGCIFYGVTNGTAYTGADAGGSFGGFIDSVTTSKSFMNLSYPVGSVVYGMDSGSTGKVLSWKTEADGERGTLVLGNVVGDFIGPRVAKGTQVDGENVFGIGVIDASSGTIALSPSPVGAITKLSNQAVLSDESHRLTTKIKTFFEDTNFVISSSQLDQTLYSGEKYFSTVVSMNYSDGITGGTEGSTVDFYVTGSVGSITFNDEISFAGYTANVLDVIKPEFQPYSGQVLYIENIRPVQRNPDQDEEIKVVFEF